MSTTCKIIDKKEPAHIPRKWRVILSSMLVVLLCIGFIPAFALTASQNARAAESVYFADVLGVSRQQFIDHLNNNSGSYLGTSYKYDWPYPTAYETGPWYSNGYHPYEAHPWNGSSGYGMNCAGFLARVLCDMGLENNGFLQSWKNAHQWMWANSETFRTTAIAYGVKYYAFDSKEAMLASGKCQKGDIVQIDSASGTNDHIGIFWGENSWDDTFWHSIYDEGSSSSGSNKISHIYGKENIGTYYLFKFDEVGSIDLQKVSNNPSITEGNDCYSLEGAEYTVYSDEACTNEVGKLVTDSSGYAKLENVSEGWKWVEETKAPEGFWRDETVYKVYVEANATVRVNGSTVEDTPINDPAPMLVQKLDKEISEKGE